tara:strand:+ start:16714 stop:17388 length:675 start_codon:yes stop_codon:yes gene_type:complete
MSLENSYIPDIIPEEDLEYFRKAGYGNRIGWGKSAAILIVDMTDEFTTGDYGVGREDTGSAAVEATAKLIDAARKAGVPVYYVKPSRNFPEGYPGATKRPGARSSIEKKESKGQNINKKLSPLQGEIILDKPRASAFFDTHLAMLFHNRGIDTVVVTGMTTSGCVRATVVDGHSSNFRIIIPIECVADRSKFANEASLFDMDMKYADVTPLESIVEKLEEIGRK